MLAKRILLIVGSVAVGVALLLGLRPLIGTIPDEYGAAYLAFTALSLAVALGVWLDKVVAAGILSE